MAIYLRNRSCRCPRCRVRAVTGGAILVTVGVLFLLSENHIYYWPQTFPVLLIVIGLLLFAARTASTEGHTQPSWIGGRWTYPSQTDAQNTGSSSGPEVKS